MFAFKLQRNTTDIYAASDMRPKANVRFVMYICVVRKQLLTKLCDEFQLKRVTSDIFHFDRTLQDFSVFVVTSTVVGVFSNDMTMYLVARFSVLPKPADYRY